MIRSVAALTCLLVSLGGCAQQLASCGAGSVSGGLVGCVDAGDKPALLALGRRYESGDGVPRDYRRAAQLYKQAAKFTSGTMFVYSPPVSKKAGGRVIPIRTGPDQPGLAEASYRLGLLYLNGRGVRVSFSKARKYLQEAADKGFAPARDELLRLDRRPVA